VPFHGSSQTGKARGSWKTARYAALFADLFDSFGSVMTIDLDRTDHEVGTKDAILELL
jgi:hypothetical protein